MRSCASKKSPVVATSKKRAVSEWWISQYDKGQLPVAGLPWLTYRQSLQYSASSLETK